MSPEKHGSLVKPTLQTPFHIDFDWWRQNDNDWRVHLFDCLCEQHQKDLATVDSNQNIDWVDPDTGEVIIVDQLRHVLMTHCAHQPDFFTTNGTLIDSVFRVFLSNGNTPVTPTELADQINKSADTILKTIAGNKVYKGIKPCIQN